MTSLSKSLKSLFRFLVYLMPVMLVLGVLDFRFHNYFWADFGSGWLRWIEPIAMFDFFSVLSVYLVLLVVMWGVLTGMGLLNGRERAEQVFSWVYVPVVLILIGAVIARIFYTPGPEVVHSFYFEIFLDYLAPIAGAAVLLFSLKESKSVFENFVKVFMGTFAVFGGVILFQHFSGVLPGVAHDFLGRLSWPYIDPFFNMTAESANHLAFLFGPVAVLGFAKVVAGARGWKRSTGASIVRRFALPAATFLISFAVVVLTKSYTGILISLMLFSFIMFVNLPKKIRLYFVVGLVVLAVAGVLSQVNTRKFQILIGNDSQETSLNRREQIYIFNYEAFKVRPIVGIGPDNYKGFFRENMMEFLGTEFPTIEVPPHTHNLLLHFWSELGVFGLAGILIIYVGVLGKLFFERRRNEFVFVLAYLLGHGLLDVPYGTPENSLMFWMVLALILVQDTYKMRAAR